jgi:hypothetical protein
MKVASLALAFACFAAVGHAQLTPTPHGISVGCGSGCMAELAVEGTRSFRISVAFAGKPKQISTPMIVSKGHFAPFRVLENGTHSGICTVFGCLLIEPTSGEFALLDATNTTLTTGTSHHVGTTVVLKLTSSHSDAAFYSSGGSASGSGSTPTQTSVVPMVGNKVWWLPRYWSTDKYSALGVNSGVVAGAMDGGEWAASRDGVNWSFKSSALSVDLYLSPDNSAIDSLGSFYDLTGSVALPPKYAFGFMACRWYQCTSCSLLTRYCIIDGGTSAHHALYSLSAVL